MNVKNVIWLVGNILWNGSTRVHFLFTWVKDDKKPFDNIKSRDPNPCKNKDFYFYFFNISLITTTKNGLRTQWVLNRSTTNVRNVHRFTWKLLDKEIRISETSSISTTQHSGISIKHFMIYKKSLKVRRV